MLKREIENKLKEWKKQIDKKCLIISGARQVGKTYIVKKFAKENYENFVEINFVEKPSTKKIFDGDLNMETILANISLYLPHQASLVPNKTLIFLDEIQACPNARTALKFFALDKRFDVIASGSLLGINYEQVSSYPTGYVEFLEMYPLTFKEFLWANGVDENVISILKDCFENKKQVNEAMNLKMMEYFKQYIVVGGMPNVVDTFINNHNFGEVLNLQKNILIDYKNDIAKYAISTEKVKAKACFESIPAQLAKDNKKFMYKSFDKNGRSQKYEGSINWLIDAGIVNICNNITTLDTPLIAYRDEKNFKLYMGDTGLLVSMLDEGSNIQIMEGNIGVYKGAIFENVIAQVLHSNGHKLYFYNRNNSLEIDFVLSKDTKIVPIEVKSANNKAKSLSTILKEKEDILGIKLVNGNVGISENMLTLPLYMVMFL
ncbi:MAG: ATP-binding protein [Bacilli bacterium]|nr:ATP-binding protein [Bacilli bacterium]